MKGKYILVVLGVLVLGGLAFLTMSRPATNDQQQPGAQQEQSPVASPSFYLVPTKSNLKAGEEFSVDVMLDTNNQKVVAVSAYLTFDPSKFQVTSIESQSSPFSIEVENMVEGNKVMLTRGEPTPGATGKVIVSRVNFKALAAGTTEMGFELVAPKEGPSRIILDDGLGTDILAGVATVKYSIE